MNRNPLHIFVVSGGVGASAEQVVNTVLAQFPDSLVEISTTGNIRERSQIGHVIAQAAASDGIIVFTLVDKHLDTFMKIKAREQGVAAIDITGPLLDLFSQKLGIEPLGRPGLYRQLHKEYFDRVAAIEYTMSHDDGRNPETWHECDLLLLGVSRTGKTPLSIYLSVLGWKVANFPLVPGLPVPEGLFRLDRAHVVGLTLSPDRLLAFRRHRSISLGVKERMGYSDPLQIAEELEYACRIFSKGGFELLDVTDKTVEASANELIKRFGPGSDPRKTPPV